MEADKRLQGSGVDNRRRVADYHRPSSTVSTRSCVIGQENDMTDEEKLGTLWDERLITQHIPKFGRNLDLGDWRG